MWKIRGFEVIDGWDVKEPQRETDGSAGYDLCAAQDVVIAPKKWTIIPTGVRAHMQPNEWLAIIQRSSIVKKGLVLANCVGVIDSDYYANADNQGHILVMLYNRGSKDVFVLKGERVAQAVFNTYLTTDNDCPVSKIRMGGVGSTG